MAGEQHYSVSQMASMFGLSRQALIYYDRIGLFSPAARSEAGYRLYLPTQIPTLRLICTMRELGFSLDELAKVVAAHDPSALLDTLPEQRARLDEKIARLEEQRDFLDQRIEFYREVAFWREDGREGSPCVRTYGERHVIFEPYPASQMTRELLHPTLSRAIARLHELAGAEAVAGFGTKLTVLGVEGGTLEGAGSFVVVPQGTRPPADALTLPAGDYACLARWGMPYDMPQVAELLSWVRDQGLIAQGDVFDFCLLDTTSYSTEHGEDYCVAQVRVG